MTKQAEPEALSVYLKSGTHAIHEQLDNHVMQLNPFADVTHYQGFLRMQLHLHTAGEPAYQDAVLQALIPDLASHSRLSAVLKDCEDMGVPLSIQQQDQQLAHSIKIAEPYAGIGWLYTIEGSSLGAAMILKHVKNSLDLSETFGAHHMAAHADGRATYWREFKAMLDALELNDFQRIHALNGAIQAFNFVTNTVNEIMNTNKKEVSR